MLHFQTIISHLELQYSLYIMVLSMVDLVGPEKKKLTQQKSFKTNFKDRFFFLSFREPFSQCLIYFAYYKRVGFFFSFLSPLPGLPPLPSHKERFINVNYKTACESFSSFPQSPFYVNKNCSHLQKQDLILCGRQR